MPAKERVGEGGWKRRRWGGGEGGNERAREREKEKLRP
jgi:hypothetical protein